MLNLKDSRVGCAALLVWNVGQINIEPLVGKHAADQQEITAIDCQFREPATKGFYMTSHNYTIHNTHRAPQPCEKDCLWFEKENQALPTLKGHF